MPSNANAVSEQKSICFLGCVPPNSSCEHPNGEEVIQWKSGCCYSQEHTATCKSLTIVSMNVYYSIVLCKLIVCLCALFRNNNYTHGIPFITVLVFQFPPIHI